MDNEQVENGSMSLGDGGNAPNLEQLIQLGIQTARQGNRQNARVIFQRVLDADRQNERAWLWMAAVSENPADRVRYLQTVLSINPRNATALRELSAIKKRQESSTSQVMLYGGMALVVIVVLIIIVLVVIFATQ